MKLQTLTMTGILGLAGIVHFLRPETFDSIVPPRLDNPRFWIYASGVAELGCATMLAVPATRRLGGTASAALMVGVSLVTAITCFAASGKQSVAG